MRQKQTCLVIYSEMFEDLQISFVMDVGLSPKAPEGCGRLSATRI
ncbi:MAG: hypothetical protein ACTSR0_03815 [Candidatus Asgardarchaeia archaeon]